jgi:prephenate dehydrogenase
MKLFQKVAIVGTGLIGGSIALAIKKKHLAREVVGVSRHKQSLVIAKQKGAIDRGSQSLNILKGADCVILATPVNTIMNLAPKVSKIIGEDGIVTDVGSTKQEIVLALEKIFPNYLGAHPLAGSEKRSIIHAHPDIFKNSLCILTPTKNTKAKTLKKLSILWRRLGAKTVSLSPQEHDKILSFVSHLPHVVAFSLIGAVPGEFMEFSSSGLKDTTRIAASDNELWADVLLSNRKNILESIDLFQRNLSRIKSAINKKDWNRLSTILKKARLKRKVLG